MNRVDRDEIGGQVRAYLGHAGMPASSPPPHLSSKIYPLLLSFRLTVSGLMVSCNVNLFVLVGLQEFSCIPELSPLHYFNVLPKSSNHI